MKRLLTVAIVLAMALISYGQVATPKALAKTSGGNSVEIFEFRNIRVGRVRQTNIVLTIKKLDNRPVDLQVELVDSDNNGSWDQAILKLKDFDLNVPSRFYLGEKGIPLRSIAPAKTVNDDEFGAWTRKTGTVPHNDQRLKSHAAAIVVLKNSANKILLAMKNNIQSLNDADIENVARAFVQMQPFFKANQY